jgi:transketolase
MLLYALLHLTGYEDMTLEQLKNFRQLGSRTAGHPEYGHATGIETTTGPLGQGLGNAVGMALAERLLNAHFGDDVVDHHTYAIVSDGCLMEGISHEAISLAGHLGLGKLIVLFDDNQITIDGATSLSCGDDQIARFQACGWAAESVDGHDPETVAAAIAAARSSDRPTMIACRTVIGFGAPSKAGTAKAHGAALGDEEIAGARENLGWPYPPFEIPDTVLETWRAAGARGAVAADAWRDRLDREAPETRDEFERRMRGDLPDGWREALATMKQATLEEAPKIATRVSSQRVLDTLAAAIPELIGGSADLTGSNLTKGTPQTVVSASDFSGGYLHYGIREHAMAAAMNGLALHGGVIPYGGTFLVFTDYCRPSIRLAALMDQRVVYVMTHDSIGCGEDGPTHQAVEHLAALRAIPKLLVFRPADTIETAECWELALDSRTAPSVLALTRQGLPSVRKEASENLCAYGGYILAPAESERQVTLIASGSEVAIALEAQALLGAQDISAAVVSLPCWELFQAQTAHYRDEVLGLGTLHIAIEAGLRQGWDTWLQPDDGFVGMKGFGASAPAGALYPHFGITAEAVVEAVKVRL